jgi:transketolase
MTDLKRRILDLSYIHQLSHLGSCLTAVNLIDAVYAVKNDDEKFMLSSGHAALALYVVLEKYKFIDAEFLVKHSGTHPDRLNTMTRAGSDIDCSTGSLGQGLPIAVGMALADRNKRVFCVISDGECSEGSIWEALRIAYEQKLKNLVVLVNVNGFGGYKEIKGCDLYDAFVGFGWIVEIVEDEVRHIKKSISQKNQMPTITFVRTDVEQYPFLKGIDAHYHVLTEEDYEQTR